MNFGMEPKQMATYQRFKDAGYEYSLTEATGQVLMIRYERGAEYTRKLSEISIDPDGFWDEIFSVDNASGQTRPAEPL